MSPIDLLWLFIIFTSLQPVFRQRLLEAQRMWLFRRFEAQRKSRSHPKCLLECRLIAARR